jgi:hypothetical protein
MRYVFSAAVGLALAIAPLPADAGLHALHALIEAHYAKHDSCFEKLRHHHAMKPKHKHKHGQHGAGGGCQTCN